MTSNADDLALAYYVIAGKDVEDPNTYYQPLPTLTGLYNTKYLSDLKIGIYSAWNKEVYNPAITSSLNDFINKLKLLGAKIVEIDIPDLDEVRLAHFITILSEISTSAKRHRENLHKYSCGTRSNVHLSEGITASVSYIFSFSKNLHIQFFTKKKLFNSIYRTTVSKLA